MHALCVLNVLGLLWVCLSLNACFYIVSVAVVTCFWCTVLLRMHAEPSVSSSYSLAALSFFLQYYENTQALRAFVTQLVTLIFWTLVGNIFDPTCI